MLNEPSRTHAGDSRMFKTHIMSNTFQFTTIKICSIATTTGYESTILGNIICKMTINKNIYIIEDQKRFVGKLTLELRQQRRYRSIFSYCSLNFFLFWLIFYYLENRFYSTLDFALIYYFFQYIIHK